MHRLSGVLHTLVGVAGLLLLAAFVASTAARADTTFATYSGSTPGPIIDSLRTLYVGEEPLVIHSMSLTPGALDFQGDCAAGSTYSVWHDVPRLRHRERCDGMPVPDEATGLNLGWQPDLNQHGLALLNSISGNSVDPGQRVLSLNGSTSSLTATYACPSPRSRAGAGTLQSVTVTPTKTATVTVCPAPIPVTVSPVDITKPPFAAAFAKFLSDPLRNGKKNVGGGCPGRRGTSTAVPI